MTTTTTSPNAQVAADLRAAAEVLRRDGWTQKLMHNSLTGCHCLLGGLAVAIGRGRFPNPEKWVSTNYLRYNRARKTLRAHLGLDDVPYASAAWVADWEWNDEPDRTADEVIAALRAAADRAEATA